MPELDALVRAHPLRERPRAQLMVALYRAGRQAEALDCYQEGRCLLDEELGLQPGDELQDLQQKVLQHDASLGAVRPPAPPAPPAHRRRRGWLALAAGSVMLAAVAIGIAVQSDEDGGEGHVVLASVPDDRCRGGTADRRRFGSAAPARLAAAGNSLWVGDDDARTLTAIDRRLGTVTRVVAPDAFPSDIAAGGGRLWAVDGERGSVIEVKPGLGTVQRRIAVGGGLPLLNDRGIVDPWAVAVGAGRVWVTDGTPQADRALAPRADGSRGGSTSARRSAESWWRAVASGRSAGHAPA